MAGASACSSARCCGSIGFLVVRSVGEALDELAAVLSVYVQPGADPRRPQGAPDAARATTPEVRSLLAPRWLPYRHGLDFVSDLAAAATNQAPDVAERRRAAAEAAGRAPRRRAPARRPTTTRTLAEDTGLVARFFTNPVAVALARFVLLALSACREAFGLVTGGGTVAGAGRTPRDWWRLQLERGTRSAPGTDVPAPAYVAAVGVAVDPAARPPGGRGVGLSCCSRCRSARGAPGGSCGSSAGSPTRRGRRAGCWPGAR